ncbi:MAG: hypothetical protein JEZ04_08650 [Spirochaetales bacterium]|nr:hypothetical protein [Spirochaetales bacterium]
MPAVKAYINLDFLPPSTERLFELPDAARKEGVNEIVLKIINNFPWEFEPRMRSDFFFPENVIAYFFRLCTQANIRISFVFPGPDDFGRLLRLSGYTRLAGSSGGMVLIDPDSVGLKSFLESIFEDVVSLVPDVGNFILRQPEKKNESSQYWTAFNKLAVESAEACGCKTEMTEREMPFTFAEDVFTAAGTGSLPRLSDILTDSIENFQKSVFKLRQFSIMSSLCFNGPAADYDNVFELYGRLLVQRRRLDESLESFRLSGGAVLDRDWLEKYLSSIRIAAEEDVFNIAMRLKQLGLLNEVF